MNEDDYGCTVAYQLPDDGIDPAYLSWEADRVDDFLAQVTPRAQELAREIIEIDLKIIDRRRAQGPDS